MTTTETETTFQSVLQEHLVGSMDLDAYMKETVKQFLTYGFTDPNTLGMIAICRDEIADPLYYEVEKHWGLTFNCCNLAGFPMMGKTGLAASTSHAPIENDVQRFVLYAMPHIAISKEGKIGEVYREGLHCASHACGALESIVHELHSGCMNMLLDMNDIEQSIVRQKLISRLHYGEEIDLMKITKLSWKIIMEDLENLLSKNLDHQKFHYGVCTGIHIHGPDDSNWIWPGTAYVQTPIGKTPLSPELNRGQSKN